MNLDLLLMPLASVTEPVEALAHKFGVTWPLLIAQILNFCVVVGLLYQFAFKPILTTLDQRQKKIEEGLQQSEAARAALSEAESKSKDLLAQATKEAKALLEEAKRLGETMKQEQTKAAYLAAEDILQKAQERIQLDYAQMTQDLQKELVRLVALTTEKVLSTQLSDNDKAAYIDRVRYALHPHA